MDNIETWVAIIGVELITGWPSGIYNRIFRMWAEASYFGEAAAALGYTILAIAIFVALFQPRKKAR